jgi:hypothetical protein
VATTEIVKRADQFLGQRKGIYDHFNSTLYFQPLSLIVICRSIASVIRVSLALRDWTTTILPIHLFPEMMLSIRYVRLLQRIRPHSRYLYTDSDHQPIRTPSCRIFRSRNSALTGYSQHGAGRCANDGQSEARRS